MEKRRIIEKEMTGRRDQHLQRPHKMDTQQPMIHIYSALSSLTQLVPETKTKKKATGGDNNDTYNSIVSINIVQDIQEEKEKSLTMWIIDTRANRHVTGHKSFFHSFQRFEGKHNVQTAGSEQVTAEGQGNIRLRIPDLTDITLKDVLYIPGCKSNLLSAVQLMKKGCELNFCGANVTATYQGTKLFVATVRNGLYVSPTQVETEKFTVSAAIDRLPNNKDIYLWHQRLGHLPLKAIKHIVSTRSANGIDLLARSSGNCTCEPCTLGKFCEKGARGSNEAKVDKEIWHGGQEREEI
jgi:hypothetical protein